MTTADQRDRYATVTAAARVFALLVLAPAIILGGGSSAILNVTLVAAVWMGAVFVEGVRRTPVMPALVVETSLVTLLASYSLVDSALLLPALVIPVFVGGLVRGVRGTLEALGAEVAVLAAVILPNPEIELTEPLVIVLFTWLMAALGFGLIAAIVHAARSEPDGTATSYRDARGLINQLLGLSGELVDGLDPVSIGQNIIDLAREELPLSSAVIYTETATGFTPLLSRDETGDMTDARISLVQRVFRTGRPEAGGAEVAIPLQTDAGVVAVLVGGFRPSAVPARAILEAAIKDLSRQLPAAALQLDTALLFTTVHHEATAEERRRLARDLHDGVAQDLASLGYLMDDLTAGADSPELVQQCQELREELTKVVADLRRSVFSLRNEVSKATSLGDSIRSMAHHLESRYGIPVEVRADEGETRLRPDVEAELLRIAQEGMNNAMKHSRGSRITVSCSVRAPAAELVVRDNGRGLQQGRDDSHGVRIMRERARRIGATLDLGNAGLGQGTELRVALDAVAATEGQRTRVGRMVAS
jgi:signal transduction histidine kinase